MFPSHARSLLLALAVLPSVAHADVIVLDAAGGGDHTSVQSAVNAAADGDIILVKPGDYSGDVFGFSIGDTSLSMVADGTSPDFRLPQLTISGLSAGKSIMLRGLPFNP